MKAGFLHVVCCLPLVLSLGAACGDTSSSVGSTGQPVVPGDACEPEGAAAPANDGCNTCTCEDGTWACTEVACECEPGDERPAGDGCNTCTCGDDGSWGCTEIACQVCEPGAERPADDGCNTCVCDDAGSAWACTERACGPGCPEPAEAPGACVAVVAWAKNPETGECCQYGTPCVAPAEWELFYNSAECEM